MKWKSLHKIAVSGSRKFEETDLVTQYIDQYIRENYASTEDVVIITGGAIGVDAAVELYCMRRGIKNLIIHARWIELELPAGPRRNRHIVDLADEMFAFWDGKSRGTSDAISRAKIKHLPLRVFSVSDLRKELKVSPPVHVVLPEDNKKAHEIRKILKDVSIDEIVEELDKKGTKKVRRFKWMFSGR